MEVKYEMSLSELNSLVIRKTATPQQIVEFTERCAKYKVGLKKQEITKGGTYR